MQKPLAQYEVQRIIWESSCLKSFETLVLLAFTNFTDGEGRCFPGIATISQMTKLSESSVKRIINKLVGMKVIKKQTRFAKDGSRTSNLYSIDFALLLSLSPVQSEPTPVQSEPTPPVSLNPPPGQSDLGSTPFNTPSSSNTPVDTPPNTHPLPLQKSADADVCVEVVADAEILEDPEHSTPLVQANSESALLVVSESSSETGSSGGCSTISHRDGASANHQNRMANVLSPARIAAIASEIQAWYNDSKPSRWGACRAITGKMGRDCEFHIRKYVGYGQTIDEACRSFVNDFKAAVLHVSGSSFHTSAKFENGNIAFLLDPRQAGRLEDFSMSWNGKGEAAQEATVRKIVTSVTDDIAYCYEDGRAFTKATKIMASQRYEKLLRTNDHRCPPIEYLQKYFPELFSVQN